MSEQQTYRAAVVGLGFVGAGDQVSGDAIGQCVRDLDGTHAPALARHPRVELVAGSSRDEARRQRFTEREGVASTYADWREMLDKESLDIVSVATNSPYHAEIAIACAAAGVKCVYCEKPLATTLADADRMIEACKQSNTLLVANHNRRWQPHYRVAKQEIADGAIGNVCHVHTHWPTGRFGCVGTHAFDAIRHLLSLAPVAVSGTLDTAGRADCRGSEYTDPGGWGIIRLEGGVNVLVDATENATLPMVIRIVGTDGQLTMHRRHATIEPWNGASRIVTGPATQPDSVTIAVAEIVECLDGNAVPSSTGEDGLYAMEMIVGFHVSSRQNAAWVDLPIQGPDRNLEVRSG